MVIPELDWKNQSHDTLDYLIILIGMLLLAVYLALWWTDGRSQYLVGGLVFLAWLALFLTEFWQPILYLVMAMLVGLLLASGLGGSVGGEPVSQIVALLNGVFLMAVIYLYISEAAAGSPA